MRISELIAALQRVQTERGDLLVSVSNQHDTSEKITVATETIEGDADPQGYTQYCDVYGD